MTSGNTAVGDVDVVGITTETDTDGDVKSTFAIERKGDVADIAERIVVPLTAGIIICPMPRLSEFFNNWSF